jgi:hypothetical protein
LPFRKHVFYRQNADEAIQRLDLLDAKRDALRPIASADTVVQASPP